MILNTRSLWLVPVLLLTLLLTACGFQLRNEPSIPAELHTLYLSLDSGSLSFNRDLRIALAQSGINVLEGQKADEQFYELKVNRSETEDRILARANDNDVTQVERRLSVTYFIRNQSGKSLYGPRTVTISVMLNNQDAEQSLKAAYNEEQIRRASSQLATELVNDLSYAKF